MPSSGTGRSSAPATSWVTASASGRVPGWRRHRSGSPATSNADGRRGPGTHLDPAVPCRRPAGPWGAPARRRRSDLPGRERGDLAYVADPGRPGDDARHGCPAGRHRASLGPGAAWLLEALPALLGADDPGTADLPADARGAALLADIASRHAGLR